MQNIISSTAPSLLVFHPHFRSLVRTCMHMLLSNLPSFEQHAHAVAVGGSARKVKLSLPFNAGGSGVSRMSTSGIALAISSMAKGMEESSSRRKELERLAVESSIINLRICCSTSLDTVSVPYLSSQYMVLIRYSCCTDNTGHTSLMISFRLFLASVAT